MRLPEYRRCSSHISNINIVYLVLFIDKKEFIDYFK